jgi:hypothetical protein
LRDGRAIVGISVALEAGGGATEGETVAEVLSAALGERRGETDLTDLRERSELFSFFNLGIGLSPALDSLYRAPEHPSMPTPCQEEHGVRQPS